MGFSLASLNPISLVADAAEKVCDAVLPKSFEFVGDLASGTLNALGGNFVGVAEDAFDLGQNIQGGVEALLKGGSWKAALDGFCKTEPEPPPSKNPGVITGEKNVATLIKIAHGDFSLGAMGICFGERHKTESSFGAKAKAAAEHIAGAVAGSDAGKVLGAAKTDAAVKPDAPARTDASATTDGVAKSAAGKGNGLDAASQGFLDSAKTDPEAFMKAIREGGVPKGLLDSEKGMMILQTTMQHIQAMNQLMTQLLKAMHDMQMATIQNIRA